MSEKVFELSGIPTISVMWRGLMFEPFKPISIIVKESEVDFYKEFIDEISIKEHKEQLNNETLVKEILKEEIAFEVSQPIVEDKTITTQKPKTAQTKLKTTTTKSVNKGGNSSARKNQSTKTKV